MYLFLCVIFAPPYTCSAVSQQSVSNMEVQTCIDFKGKAEQQQPQLGVSDPAFTSVLCCPADDRLTLSFDGCWSAPGEMSFYSDTSAEDMGDELETLGWDSPGCEALSLPSENSLCR